MSEGMNELMNERMKDMKRIMMIMVLGVLIVCSVSADNQNVQEWKSTSVMQTSGSTYSPPVTAVGAMSATSEATTTESYSPAKLGGPRRTQSSGDPWGQNQDGGDTSEEGSPIGDAVLPLLLLAAAFCGLIALRRKRKQSLTAEG